MILGIDEAGRGPWAGPLVVGAVVLGGAEIEGLTDSKKLTKRQREALEPIILERAVAVATGWVTANELDEMGMSEALRLATRRAVEQIRAPYHEIIIDGTVNFLSGTGKGEYVTTMPKADLLVPSVSAASVIAKVARDRYMAAQDEVYPGYGFGGHAGYGVAKHRAAIERLGVTPLHRLSFAPLAKYRGGSSPVLPEQKPSRLRRIFSHADSLSSAELAIAQTSSTRQESAYSQIGQTPTVSLSGHTGDSTRAIGNASETIAAEELVRRGHKVLERNWKTKYCEIDIVSQKDDTIYFTEVKHRKNDKAGDGLAAITPKKLQQMQFAARAYAHSNQLTDVDLQLIAIATTGSEPYVTSYVEIV